MKNKLLFGAFIFAGIGSTFAQTSVYRKHELNLEAAKPTTISTPKALGTVVWRDNFDSIVSGAGLATVSTSSWTADNSGQTGANYGWTTDAVYNGWWISGTGTSIFNSTSRGKFGEMSNGPTASPGIGVVYTLTSGVINVQTLAGGNNALLRFQQTGAKFYDLGEVLVSVDGTTWTKVYDTSHKAMHTQTSSNPWPNPETVEVDISNAIQTGASTVQIRFRWTSERDITTTNPNAWVSYGWYIDDIEIATKNDFDLVNTYSFAHTEMYQYSQIPLSQIAPITFRAGVKNQGSQNLTNVVLNVTGNGITETSTGVTLLPGAVDTLEVEYTPTVVGSYTVNQNLTLTEADDNLTNNSIFTPVKFDVTNHIYAVDKGAPFTEYPLTGLIDQSNNPVVIDGVGNAFDIFNDQEIHGINFRLFTGTPVGAEVYGELYEYNPAATQLSNRWTGPLTETDMFAVASASQANQIQTLQFLTPYYLESGKTYLVLLRIAGSLPVKVAAGGETYTGSGQCWIRTVGGNTWGTFTDIPVVRANFNPSLGIENQDLFSGVSIFPNPAKDKATVEFNLATSSSVSVEVTDITGKVVESVSLTNVAAGNNSTTVNVAGLSTGVYSVAIKSNDSKVTRKLIVQ